jgi:head-tail adaptor
MKFATLALLGAVSAQDMLDAEVEEMIKVVYPWAAVKDYAKQGHAIEATAESIGDDVRPRIRDLMNKIDVIGQRLDVVGDFLEPRAERIGQALVTPGMKIESKLHGFVHGKLSQAAERQAEAEWKQMEPEFDRHAQNMRKRYVPELEAWGKSKAVAAKRANEEAWMNSAEMKALLKSVHEIQTDADQSTRKMRWGAAGTEEGWTEWANNDAVAEMIEDVVEILRNFKALMTNKQS